MVAMKLLRMIRRGVGIGLLVCSVLILTWNLWPAREAERSVLFPEISSEAPESSTIPMTKTRYLLVDWPEKIAAGRIGRVSIRLELKDLDEGAPGNQSGAPIQPGFIEARLELAGIPSIPAGVVQKSPDISGSLEFLWQIRPEKSGIYQGAIWLHRVSQLGTIQRRELISVQPLEIHAVTFLGLNAYIAQVIGIIGCIAGAALCIDLFFGVIRHGIG
jgi:hypothetical protein